MITQIQGKLIEKNPTNVVVECNGVCYEINISMHTFSLLPSSDFLKIHTHLQVKEDSHTLYGFIENAKRELFRLLISVSGIGTNTARVMLSSLSPKQIQQAIAVADVATIQSIKGIGAKTAQRVILDLKEKVLKVFGIDEVSSALNNTNKEEALSALEVLGYARKQADKICSKIVGSSPDASVETIIKLALKSL